MSNHINVNVLPKLSKEIDPDVKSVLEAPDKNIDVMRMQHEPTEEEMSEIKKNKSIKDSNMWTYVMYGVIILGILLIILGIVYMCRDTSKPTSIPNSMLNPNYMGYGRMPMYAGPLPPQSGQPPASKPDEAKKPTKKELEETLSKLETIPESDDEPPKKKKLKPRKSITLELVDNETKEPKEPKEPKENKENKENKEDDITKKFYNGMQTKLDLDKADSDEEEGRAE